MKASIIPHERNLAEERTGWFERMARAGLFARLREIRTGEIIIQEGQEVYHFGKCSQDFPAPVRITVHSPLAYLDLALDGSVGAGSAYMFGLWTCDDLTTLTQLLLRNLEVADSIDGGMSRFKAAIHKLAYLTRRNTRRASQRHVRSHYDLGNDFFALFLDSSMMYSAAIYEEPHYDLEQAALAKIDRICRKLELKPDDHVLEIGTGWGGFALHAAHHYGCRVTTTTISREQYDFAREQVVAAGLEDRVKVLLEDYRDLEGRYDKLVSIEMIEAIGHQYLDTYFATVNRLLKPDGLMLLQAITMNDQRYEQAKSTVDFIKRYIFPGGFLPSVTAMSDAIARKSDMRIYHLEDIGIHYARTLRDWRQRFRNRIDAVKAQGYPESFIRMWEFYLCYCEAGFRERFIGTVQILLIKPDNRRDALIAPIRG